MFSLFNLKVTKNLKNNFEKRFCRKSFKLLR